MIKSNCKQCGKEVVRNGSKAAVFCSLDCKGEWQKTQKPVDEEWLRQKYLVEKLSTYDIAKIVSRDPKQVHNWLRGYGIATRPRGQNLSEGDAYPLNPENPPTFLGKTHTKQTRKILSKKASRPKPWLRGESNGMFGKAGKENPNYKDGSAPERQKMYARGEGKEFIRAILERDNYQCQRCSSPQKEKKWLHVHHIKPWAGNEPLRFDKNNCVVLCKECHQWVHSSKNSNRDFLG